MAFSEKPNFNAVSCGLFFCKKLKAEEISRWEYKSKRLRMLVQKECKPFVFKVRIFWEGHKILRNLHLTFDYSTLQMYKAILWWVYTLKDEKLWNRRPVLSTDQAIPCCFYFRISWILMEQRCFLFFCPLGFLSTPLRTSRISRLKSQIMKPTFLS